VILAAILALSIGLSLGMLGGGGSILTVPILVHARGVEERTAMASSLVVSAITSLVALVRPARAKQVAWRTGLLFAASGMVGSFLGGRLSHSVPKRALVVLFVSMMVATSFAMLRGRKEPTTPTILQPSKVLATGVVVGSLTGLVGAGGGFVIVPALALVGGLPMRTAVGTSLFVIALQSATGFIGHAANVTIDLRLIGTVTASASLGAIAGGHLGARINQDQLRRGFGVFVLAVAAYMGWKELSRPNAESSSRVAATSTRT
jgi:uncharacterized membrane protein YfcA